MTASRLIFPLPWLIPIIVISVLTLALLGCSTKPPAYMRELPPLPAALAAPPEPLVPIKRSLPAPQPSQTSPNR